MTEHDYDAEARGLLGFGAGTIFGYPARMMQRLIETLRLRDARILDLTQQHIGCHAERDRLLEALRDRAFVEGDGCQECQLCGSDMGEAMEGDHYKDCLLYPTPKTTSEA